MLVEKEPVDRRIFDALMRYVAWGIKEGYVKAWFTWLGWAMISSALLAIGESSGALIIKFVGFVSCGVVILAGLVGIEELRDRWLENNKNKINSWISIVAILISMVLSAWVVVSIFQAILNSVLLRNTV